MVMCRRLPLLPVVIFQSNYRVPSFSCAVIFAPREGDVYTNHYSGNILTTSLMLDSGADRREGVDYGFTNQDAGFTGDYISVVFRIFNASSLMLLLLLYHFSASADIGIDLTR